MFESGLKKTRLTAVVLILFCSAGSFAAPTRAAVSLSTETLVSPDYQATNTKSFGFLSFQLSNVEQKKEWDYVDNAMQAELRGSFAMQNPAMSYLNISQLYVKQWDLSVGRKLETWSHADELWNLGLYQPQFAWNPLLLESQGLTGIFVDLPGPDTDQPWGLKAFASVLYIPDQGASYTLKDGQFEQNNPWFRQLPRRIQYDDQGNVIDTLTYDVLKPSTNEIIFNSSYAAQFYWGKKDQGFSMASALAYKPSHQLAMGLSADVKTGEITNVQVTPKIYYHSLSSVDARYAWAHWAAGLGIVRENPSRPSFAPEQTYKFYSESVTTSPYIEFFTGSWRMDISWIDIQGAAATTTGPKADKFGAILPERFNYQKAGQIGAAYSYFWKKHEGLKIQSRYLQGEKNQFSQLTTDFQYQIDSSWQTGARLLLVRSENTMRNIYADFQNNDELMMGVSYAF